MRYRLKNCWDICAEALLSTVGWFKAMAWYIKISTARLILDLGNCRDQELAFVVRNTFIIVRSRDLEKIDLVNKVKPGLK